MNFIPILPAVLLIFWLIEDATSSEAGLRSDTSKTPLALVKKRDSKLQLAIPKEYRGIFAVYDFDKTEDENGLAEKFVIACPRGKIQGPNLEENDKRNKKRSKYSKLLFLHVYDEHVAYASYDCSKDIVPLIAEDKKMDNKDIVENCRSHEAQIYNIGYPIVIHEKDEDEEIDLDKDIEFVPIYKMCYSMTNQKIIYTIHHLESWDLLLNKLWTFYTIDPRLSFKSIFNRSDKESEILFQNRYAYQFVGFDDLLSKVLERAVSFQFNYVPIPKNEDLLNGLIAADNYIRLLCKETNKKLTLYSGLYQTTALSDPQSCLNIFCTRDRQEIKIDYLWRLIMDNEDRAAIIITQFASKNCYDICNGFRKNEIRYKKGGCTYSCSVNDPLIEKLGLPQLSRTGELSLTFPQKISKKDSQPTPDEQGPSFVEPSKEINILDFMKKGNFMNALIDADPDLAEKVQVQSSEKRGGYVAETSDDDNEDSQ